MNTLILIGKRLLDIIVIGSVIFLVLFVDDIYLYVATKEMETKGWPIYVYNDLLNDFVVVINVGEPYSYDYTSNKYTLRDRTIPWLCEQWIKSLPRDFKGNDGLTVQEAFSEFYKAGYSNKEIFTDGVYRALLNRSGILPTDRGLIFFAKAIQKKLNQKFDKVEIIATGIHILSIIIIVFSIISGLGIILRTEGTSQKDAFFQIWRGIPKYLGGYFKSHQKKSSI